MLSASVIFIIVVTAIIQSIFGVGVLLFGTPLLLLLGNDFVSTLGILLPISLCISALQFFEDRKHVDYQYFKQLLVFSIPPIVIVLALAISLDINLSLPIGVFLLFISAKNVFRPLELAISKIFAHERSFLVIQGVLHGLTNLGGALLSSKVFSMNKTKQEKRALISLSYFTFATFQILTLVTMGAHHSFDPHYLMIGIATFFFANQLIYKKLATTSYNSYFSVFLFCSGVMLVYRGVL